VFNLASPASPAYFRSKAIEIADANSLGTRNVLALARRCKATFVQASTSECYGDPDVSPQSEDYLGRVNCTGPRAVYDEGKRFSEALVMAYRRCHQLSTRIVRIFNTYGPRMRSDDGRALPNLMKQALASQPLTIYGDGMQTRSFCYVSDLVDGIWLLAQSDVTAPVNIGNPDEITILQLAQEIQQVTGSASPIVHEPLPPDDPRRRRPDITRARTLLSWEPRVSRPEGLSKTLEYFRAQLT
jgi:dTDP-glucose 4,6-dehydratase